MLFGTLTHPPLLSALARAGHGSKILLSDGNYPHSTGAPASAERIFLNLAPGLLSVDDVLRVLTASVPLEAAEVMLPPDGVEVPAIIGYRDMLPEVSFIGHDRFGFYEAARHPDVAIVVATGDQRVYANLLLTIGVRQPDDPEQ
ncbi:MAG: RbsD/FucU family protein [Thermomicrobiales bacterium]|nr:RbsD/FucU family protein [Thermomicrobiales bacterium]MCO5225681.1 RbsD/FucU family protein [Thermomicrobiales bacterium]MCO5227967.1 RbsD/FucU family protein [Thermomicrobiales bacterium]